MKKVESFGLRTFPIGFWNYLQLGENGEHVTESEVQGWAEAGITLTQGGRFDPDIEGERRHMIRQLDWAHARGIKLIPWDLRLLGTAPSVDVSRPANYIEAFRKSLQDLEQHPALFGYFVGDEPGRDSSERVFGCYRIQKELAPNLHPYLNLLPHFPGFEHMEGHTSWADYLDEFVTKSNADLISYDCYAQMNMEDGEKGLHDYYRNLRLYREAALRHGVPFWNTPLCMGHNQYRCPNYDDLRWQFNTSVASGAHGILWFHYYQTGIGANYRFGPIDELWEKTQTYYDLRRVHLNFHRIYGDLFNHLASTRVSFFGTEYGGGEAWTPNALVTSIWPAYNQKAPILVGEFVDAQERRYVMFVNNSTTKTDRVLVQFPKGTKLYSWDNSGRERQGGACSADGAPYAEPDGTVSAWHWFAPGQEAVYRIELGT